MNNMTQTVNRFLKNPRSMEATMPKPKTVTHEKEESYKTILGVAVFSSQTPCGRKKSRQHPLLPQRVQKREEVICGSDVQAVGSAMTRTAGCHKRHSSTSQVISTTADRMLKLYNKLFLQPCCGHCTYQETTCRWNPKKVTAALAATRKHRLPLRQGRVKCSPKQDLFLSGCL